MSGTLPPLYPLNDWSSTIAFKAADPTTGKLVAFTPTSVTAFLATSDAPTATAADASIVVTCSQTTKAGTWFVGIDGSVLQPDVLETLFSTTSPVLIVASAENIRVAVTLTYAPSRPMTVA